MEHTTETPMDLYRIKVSELQGRLAKKATENPEHRFNNLYDLLTWEPLMVWAFDTLMTNRGSRTAGVDGMDKRTAKDKKGEILTSLRTALKSGTFHAISSATGIYPQAQREATPARYSHSDRPAGSTDGESHFRTNLRERLLPIQSRLQTPTKLSFSNVLSSSASCSQAEKDELDY